MTSARGTTDPGSRDFRAVTLDQLLTGSALRVPAKVAVVDTLGGLMTYAELDAASDRVAARLASLGVARGDRVGLWMEKRCDAVSCIFGILKCGAAYVPVDPAAPTARGGGILTHCRVSATIADSDRAARLGRLDDVPNAGRLITFDGDIVDYD